MALVNLTVSPEVMGIIGYLETSGVPHRVTSTWRPGATTLAGNTSRHALKLAVDFAGPTPSVDSASLGAIFKAFVPVEAHLDELIYAGPQVSYNIKRGRRVPKYAQAAHHNHVHVAVNTGVDLLHRAPKHAPQADQVEAPSLIKIGEGGREDMAEPVDAIPWGEGALVLTRDGGVRAYDAPFFGSFPGLPPEQRLATAPFVQIIKEGSGYTCINSSGQRYHFPDPSL